MVLVVCFDAYAYIFLKNDTKCIFDIWKTVVSILPGMQGFIFYVSWWLLVTWNGYACLHSNPRNYVMQHAIQVSYNGDYISLPGWWCRLDSCYLPMVVYAKTMSGTDIILCGVFFMVTCAPCSVMSDIRCGSSAIFFTTSEWCIISKYFFCFRHYSDVVNIDKTKPRLVTY